MNVAGVVVAAGTGSRFGRPKHTLLISGRPLWVHAAEALVIGGCVSVVVVGDVPDGIPGGERRRDSVLAGLEALGVDVTHVLVHDAARPAASPELVGRVIQRLATGDADAVVPAIPLTDTIKRVSGDRVVITESRDELVAVQTPQGFALEVLRAAHAADEADATDDAALVERAGGTVVTVPGEPGNIKITYPWDYQAVKEAME